MGGSQKKIEIQNNVMENFELFIEPVALQDIQDAIDYYESKSYGLGEAFENELNIHLLSIKKVVFFSVKIQSSPLPSFKKFPLHDPLHSGPRSKTYHH